MDSAIREGIKKFEADNLGGEPHVTEGSWRYFVSGATREISPSGYGGLFPPPSDPVRRTKLIAYYWALTLAVAVNDFQKLKRKIRHDIEIGQKYVRLPTEPGSRYSSRDLTQAEAFAELRELQREVRRCKAKHDEAEVEVLRARTGMSPEEYERHCEQQQYLDQVEMTRKVYALNALEKFEV